MTTKQYPEHECLTEEEAQLVIGAIPLQVLPRDDDECAFIHALPSGSVRCGALRWNHSQYTGHKFTEPHETDSLRSLSALLKDPSYMTLPRARQIAIKHAHWNATTLPNNEFSLSWQDTKVLLDANAALVEQRDRLLQAAKFVLSTPGLIRGRDSLQRIVDEVIATIEQETEMKSNTSGEAGR